MCNVFTVFLQDPVRPQELSSQGLKLEAAIRAGAQAVLNMKDMLNEWDSIVGDGDCGTTVRACNVHYGLLFLESLVGFVRCHIFFYMWWPGQKILCLPQEFANGYDILKKMCLLHSWFKRWKQC
jgi:hypothetical protein